MDLHVDLMYIVGGVYKLRCITFIIFLARTIASNSIRNVSMYRIGDVFLRHQRNVNFQTWFVGSQRRTVDVACEL